MHQIPDRETPRLCLGENEATDLARALEELTISLREAGDAAEEVGLAAGPVEQYLVEGGGWRRLSHARYLVHLALSRTINDDDAEEAVYEGIPYWSESSRICASLKPTLLHPDRTAVKALSCSCERSPAQVPYGSALTRTTATTTWASSLRTP